jgi:hypothetical protein
LSTHLSDVRCGLVPSGAWARLEARVALESLLERVVPGRIRFSEGFERKWMPLPYMLGFMRLDVELGA